MNYNVGCLGSIKTNDAVTTLRSLNALHGQVRKIIARHNFSKEDAQRLSQYVTETRMLLTELEKLEIKTRRCNRMLAEIRALKKSYWDLEGLVKETRNDCCRQAEDLE